MNKHVPRAPAGSLLGWRRDPRGRRWLASSGEQEELAPGCGGCSPHGNASWRWLCHGPRAEGLRGESAGASGTSPSAAAARAAGTAPCTASRSPAPIPALPGCTNTLLCLCPSWVPLLLPSAPELGVCSQRLPSALAPQARAPALVSEGSGAPMGSSPRAGTRGPRFVVAAGRKGRCPDTTEPLGRSRSPGRRCHAGRGSARRQLLRRGSSSPWVRPCGVCAGNAPARAPPAAVCTAGKHELCDWRGGLTLARGRAKPEPWRQTAATAFPRLRSALPRAAREQPARPQPSCRHRSTAGLSISWLLHGTRGAKSRGRTERDPAPTAGAGKGTGHWGCGQRQGPVCPRPPPQPPPAARAKLSPAHGMGGVLAPAAKGLFNAGFGREITRRVCV